MSDYNPQPRPPDASRIRWSGSGLSGRGWTIALLVFVAVGILTAVGYFIFESTWTDRECEEIANRRVTNQEQADRRYDELTELGCL